MRVRSVQDHFNDYPIAGVGAAVGEDRYKAKGVEYDIEDEVEAKRLIEYGVVAKAAEKKSES